MKDMSNTKRADDATASQKEVRLTAALKGRLREKISEEALKRVESVARKVRVTQIRYRSNGHGVNGFIVEPRTVRGKLPCIVFNRGGYGDFGSLRMYYVFTILGMLASWGYVVVASQYSGNAGSDGKDEWGGADLEDVLALRGILAKHPHADISRIGMCGVSRGGMMTYLAMTRVRWIRAAASVAGVSDLIRQAKLRPEMQDVFDKAFGGSMAEKRKRSAVLWAEKLSKKTPLLLLHGTADVRVSPIDSLELSRALVEHGVYHRLIVFENDDHSLTGHEREKWDEIRHWFDRFVKNRKKLSVSSRSLE